MSYSGEIEAIGIPAIGAYLLKQLANAALVGVRAAETVQQTVHVRQMRSRLASLIFQVQSAQNDMTLALRQLEHEQRLAYADAVQKLRASDTADTSAFLQECAKTQQQLDSVLAGQRRILETQTIAVIRETMRSGQALLSRERRETALSLQRMQSDAQRLTQAETAARSLLAEGFAMADDLRQSYGMSRTGQQAVQTCEETLRRAQMLLDASQPEAALTAAGGAVDALLLRVTELLVSECRTSQVYHEVQSALAAAHAGMEAQRQTTFRFENTRDGHPAEREIADFAPYYRGAWEMLSTGLSQIEQLMGGDPLDTSPEILHDLLTRLRDWQERFQAETALAYERLGNEMLRMETGRLLVQHYLTQGYRMAPLTAEDRAVSPLDALIVRLQKADTGAALSLRLCAVSDAQGHITMQIGIEDHNRYEGDAAQVEQARRQQREGNCTLLEHSPVGRGMQFRQRCKNPGVPDVL